MLSGRSVSEKLYKRIMGKCVMHVTKPDVIDASGSLQVCAGHKSGSEAAIHTMRSIFDVDETDPVLLINASNAFNALNGYSCSRFLGETEICILRRSGVSPQCRLLQRLDS